MDAVPDDSHCAVGDQPIEVPAVKPCDSAYRDTHIEAVAHCDVKPANMIVISSPDHARFSDQVSRGRIGRTEWLLRAIARVKAARDGLALIDCCGTTENRVQIWYSECKSPVQLPQLEGSRSDSQISFASPYELVIAAPSDASSTTGVPAEPVGDAAPTDDNARFRVLPTYAGRPFALSAGACCRGSLPVITPETITTARANSGDLDSIMKEIVVIARGVFGLLVKTRDKRIAQDYREGLRRFLDGILAILRRVVVMVLAALSHSAVAPAFLLVILATVRHYGHRGEPDGHFLPAPALQPRSQGAVCLVT